MLNYIWKSILNVLFVVLILSMKIVLDLYNNFLMTYFVLNFNFHKEKSNQTDQPMLSLMKILASRIGIIKLEWGHIGPFLPFWPQALLGEGEKNVLSCHSNNKTFPIKIENLLKLSTQIPFASWQIWTIWCNFNQRWFNYLNHHSLAF